MGATGRCSAQLRNRRVGERDPKDREVLMPSKRANVKNEKQYEALKEKGMSKERRPGSRTRPAPRRGAVRSRGPAATAARAARPRRRRPRAARAARPRPRRARWLIPRSTRRRMRHLARLGRFRLVERPCGLSDRARALREAGACRGVQPRLRPGLVSQSGQRRPGEGGSRGINHLGAARPAVAAGRG